MSEKTELIHRLMTLENRIKTGYNMAIAKEWSSDELKVYLKQTEPSIDWNVIFKDIANENL